MANFVPIGSDLDAQELSALRKQKVAEMLMMQATQGVQPFQRAGRTSIVPMHFTQGLAQVMQAYMARKRGNAADAELAGIGDSRKRVADAAMEKFQAKSAGAPVSIALGDVAGGPDQQMQQQYKADPEGAALELAGNAAVPEASRDAGMLQYQMGVRRQEKEAALAAQVAAAEEAARERESLEKLRIADKAEGRDQISADRRYAADQNTALRRDLAAATAEKPPKPEKGMRYNADGDLEVIPGSTEDLKRQKQVEVEKTAQGQTLSVLDAEIRNIDQMIGRGKESRFTGDKEEELPQHKGLNAAVGSIDQYTPTFFGETADFEALRDSLASKTSISALKAIRAGGSQSIGTITEREWPRLESLKTTLQPGQKQERFPQRLAEYRDELLRVRNEVAGADFGSPTPNGPRAPAAPADAAAQLRAQADAILGLGGN